MRLSDLLETLSLYADVNNSDAKDINVVFSTTNGPVRLESTSCQSDLHKTSIKINLVPVNNFVD